MVTTCLWDSLMTKDIRLTRMVSKESAACFIRLAGQFSGHFKHPLASFFRHRSSSALILVVLH